MLTNPTCENLGIRHPSQTARGAIRHDSGCHPAPPGTTLYELSDWWGLSGNIFFA